MNHALKNVIFSNYNVLNQRTLYFESGDFVENYILLSGNNPPLTILEGAQSSVWFALENPKEIPDKFINDKKIVDQSIQVDVHQIICH